MNLFKTILSCLMLCLGTCHIAEAKQPSIQTTLYYKPGCPYCDRVIQFMQKNHISIPMKNIASDFSAKDYLIKNGGKQQVPCLFINGKAMYESSDIIRWLEKNKEDL